MLIGSENKPVSDHQLILAIFLHYLALPVVAGMYFFVFLQFNFELRFFHVIKISKFSWMDGNYKPENSISFDQTTARQEQQCDSQETTPAVITSQNYPSSYQRNSDCRYCVRSRAAGIFHFQNS